MAGANLPAKKYKKTTPTQTRLVFDFTEEQSGGYIDLAQCLSAINRRFYRQGVYYYVNSFEVQNLEEGYVDLFVAPDTWMTKNAWNRAFGTFQQMNAQSDTPRPKYHDFKVFLDNNHRVDLAGGTQNLMPSGIAGIGAGTTETIWTDEWQYSQFVSMVDRTPESDTPNQFNIHVVGPHSGTGPSDYNSIGMISSYSASRSYPDPDGEPTLPSGNDDDPLTQLFQASEVHAVEEISEHLDVSNDETPYNGDYYFGSGDKHLVPLRRMQTGAASTGRSHEISGACVPFGLIRVASTYITDWRLIINVASGTYNGVYAERC